MPTKPLTATDEAILKRSPEGWFQPRDLPTDITRREYRCERLEEAGVLKSKVVGEYPALYREYCKIRIEDKESNHG